MPETEQRELAKMYERKGLSRETAKKVAQELTEHDALAAHADIEFGIDPENLTNAWHAAFASMVAFTIGALLPLLTITLTPLSIRVWATVITVALALAIAGIIQARLGYSPVRAGRDAQRHRRSPGHERHVRRREPGRPDGLTRAGPDVRMFAAVVPPPEVVEHLDAFLDVRRAAGAFRWVTAEHLHVTVAFLAEVPDRKLDDLVDRLARAAARRACLPGGGRRWRCVPEPGPRPRALGGARPGRPRAHRADPAGHRRPGRGQPGRRTRGRSAVPCPRHARPPRPARRGEQLGTSPRRLPRPHLDRRPAHPGGVVPRRRTPRPTPLPACGGVRPDSVVPDELAGRRMVSRPSRRGPPTEGPTSLWRTPRPENGGQGGSGAGYALVSGA